MSIVPINSDKRALRIQLLAHRQSMSHDEKQQRDYRLCHQLYQWINTSVEKWQAIALYSPIRGEPDVMPLADILLNEGFKVLLPVVVEKNTPLKFAPFVGKEHLQESVLGILEPLAYTPQTPDVIVVPCVGFDAHHHRLGYGGGFYDRTLADFNSKGVVPTAIGVAYREALCAFETSEFDIRLDKLMVV